MSVRRSDIEGEPSSDEGTPVPHRSFKLKQKSSRGLMEPALGIKRRVLISYRGIERVKLSMGDDQPLPRQVPISGSVPFKLEVVINTEAANANDEGLPVPLLKVLTGDGGGQPPSGDNNKQLCQEVNVRLGSWLAAHCPIPNNKRNLSKVSSFESYKRTLNSRRSRTGDKTRAAHITPAIPPKWEYYDELSGWAGRYPSVNDLLTYSKTISTKLGDTKLDRETTNHVLANLGKFYWKSSLQDATKFALMDSRQERIARQESGMPLEQYPDDEYVHLTIGYLLEARPYQPLGAEVCRKKRVTSTTTPELAVKAKTLPAIGSDYTLLKDEEWCRYRAWWTYTHTVSSLARAISFWPKNKVYGRDKLRYFDSFLEESLMTDEKRLHVWFVRRGDFENRIPFNGGYESRTLYAPLPAARLDVCNNSDVRWNTYCSNWYRYLDDKLTKDDFVSRTRKLWEQVYPHPTLEEEIAFYIKDTVSVAVEGEFIPKGTKETKGAEANTLGLSDEDLGLVLFNVLDKQNTQLKARASLQSGYNRAVRDSIERKARYEEEEVHYLNLKRGFENLASLLKLSSYSLNLEDTKLLGHLRQ